LPPIFLYINKTKIVDIDDDLKYDFLDTKPIVVNPHYFGDIKITPKSNEQSKFIIVGEIARARRNFLFLIDSMKDIINSTKKDFKISIVSKTPVKEIKKIILYIYTVYQFKRNI